MRKRVYISYDRTHQRAVAELYQDLVALGHQAWLDRSLPGGADWWHRVVTNIEHCDVFVSTLSSHALSSAVWEAELDAATHRAEDQEHLISEIRDEMAKWRETCLTTVLVNGQANQLESLAGLVLG